MARTVSTTNVWRIRGASLAVLMLQSPALAQSLPHFERRGEATQLIVDDKPYLALAGELHNSSPSSPAYMAPIWDRLARRDVRTVIGAASWELVEPKEGQYDFAAVDDQIRQAHARGMRLIMIWFGAYKNAESKYAPSWVRRDERRFPREKRGIETRMSSFKTVLTVFNDRLVEADARAFAALMRHIKAVDTGRTVIMMQVENEVGLLGASRGLSDQANAAWNSQVPAELTAYLRRHRAELRPHLAKLWGRQGFPASGTWAQMFGSDAAADEVFMAWGFARYVERVARAGLREYALPMYANAWLGPQPGFVDPGDYPSGGPVARMMDVWKAAAPSLSLLAPDIYVDDFSGTLADYRTPSNPIFLPEVKFDAGNLFVALGQYAAIAFSPFGIEGKSDDDDVFKAYAVLNDMTAIITQAQSAGRIRGFKLAPGSQSTEHIGAYDLAIAGPGATIGIFGAGTGEQAVKTPGYGLIVQTGDDDFLVVGRGISITFTKPGVDVEIDRAEEGVFDKGEWKPGRVLNGDERHRLFPNDDLRIVRVSLLRRQADAPVVTR